MRKIKAVLKVGGSIINNKKRLLNLCGQICKIDENIVVVPGGGRLADVVRSLNKEFRISDSAAHWMAIKAMDINGILISDLNKRMKPVKSRKECFQTLEQSKIPVFLTYEILKKRDPLPKSWNVTSDSISLYLAETLNSDMHILLKDVDGIYRNIEGKKTLLKEVDVKRLKSMKNTCVDSYFPKLISAYKRESYVISGFHPERVKKVLNNEKVIGTKIVV